MTWAVYLGSTVRKHRKEMGKGRQKKRAKVMVCVLMGRLSDGELRVLLKAL